MFSRLPSLFQSISPGLVDTELLRAGTTSLDAEELFNRLPSLKPSDIADAVMYVLSTPCNVQVPSSCGISGTAEQLIFLKLLVIN
jgi:NADP-dependent 3-hydroxy acid dehydrogenase YdfG